MKPTRIFVLAVVFVLSAFASTGCKRAEDKPAAPARPAPAWKLRALDGREVSSTQFAGKVVMMNFWATWCPPCRAEIPDLIALQAKYEKDGLVVLGVSVDQGGVELVKAFVAQNKINYPIVMADELVAEAFGGFDGIPATFIIDRQGQIRDRVIGADSAEGFEARIKPLLAASKD